MEIYTLTSFGLRKASDVPQMDEEWWSKRERVREIAGAVEGMQEEMQLFQAPEEQGPPANPPQDIVTILLRLEERMERIEKKIDALRDNS